MTAHRPILPLLAGALLLGCQPPAALLRITAAPTPPAAPQPALTAPPRVAAGPVAMPAVLIAELGPGVKPAAWMTQPALAGFTLRRSVKLGESHLLKLGLPAGLSPTEAQARLNGLPGLTRATEDVLARPAAFTWAQQDARYGEQWAHRPPHGDTETAWSRVPVADQAKVIVAVLDTGVDTSHPEFVGRLVGARNFTADPIDADVTDGVGHGTHCAGIIGAQGDNGQGIAGVAWGAKIMPVKVLGDEGGSTFDVIDGILYAANYPATAGGARVRVISLSLGSGVGGVSTYYAKAIAEARAKGVLVVASAGNDGRDVVSQPATTPHCLSVGATGHYLGWEFLAAFSNHGDRLTLSAPGEDILSTLPLDGSQMGQAYGLASGTSMACPYVAGVAALVMAKYDRDNTAMTAAFVDQVSARLIAACDDLGAPGRDPIYGAGSLNAARAVTPATIDAAP